MIDGYERYAISWIPRPHSPLAVFGATWTGWCPDAGERRPRRQRSRLPLPPDRVVGRLERQGIHAVIRPPFRLRSGRSTWAFERELSALAEALDAFTLPRLAVAIVDERIALVPARRTASLDRFLATIARRLDPFDAGPGQGDAEAMRAAPLGRAGAVPDGFVMPLTRRLASEEAEALARPLARELEPVLAEPIRVEDFALVGDPGQGRPLRVLERFALSEPVAAGQSDGLACFGPTLFAPFLLGRRALENA